MRLRCIFSKLRGQAVSIKEDIQKHIKSAMKEKDSVKLGVLRMVFSQIRKGEIDERKEFSDVDVLRVIKRGIKSREESVIMYKKGGRDDLARKERAEVDILKDYLPAQLSIEEIERIVEQIIQDKQLSSLKDIGVVMREVMNKYASQVDGKTVQEVARIKLQ